MIKKEVWEMRRSSLSLLLTLALLFCMVPMVASADSHPFEGGDGTESNPYQITNAKQLATVREAVYLEDHFILMNDIDLTGYLSAEGEGYNDGKGWVPIGENHVTPFKGTFDGNEKTIRGLSIDDAGRNYVGLFGSTEETAVIKNLHLEDVNVEGRTDVGAVAGTNVGTIKDSTATGNVKGGVAVGVLVGNNAGNIENSSAEGIVEGVQNVGGLVGNSNSRATIRGSKATSTVIGNHRVGGLVGNNRGTIENSVAEGDVEGTTENIGGLVGVNNGGTILNSRSEGNVEGSNRNVGGLVGRNTNRNENEGRIESSYATGDVTGDSNIGGLAGQNEGTIEDSHSTGDVTGVESSESIGGLVGYNKGTIESSYADGDVTGQERSESIGGLVGFNDEEGTIEISRATGDVTGSESSFIGGLVGTNLGTIISSSATGAVTGENDSSPVGGLAGYSDGEIRDSRAEGAVQAEDLVGGLVAENRGKIEDSYATGNVTGNDNVGGLVGVNFRTGKIEASYATNTVKGVKFVGGLAGDNWGEIEDSSATGNVTGNERIGGLVGRNDEGTIERSYAAGAVTGKVGTESAGGLVGLNDEGDIRKSYATGAVTGGKSSLYVGGLVGRNDDGHIENTYAIGEVSGNSDVGGLVGGNYEGTVENSYFDKETTRQDDIDKGDSRTTDQMTDPYDAETTYIDWDFTDIWDIDSTYNNGYPFFRWSYQPPSEPPVQPPTPPSGGGGGGSSITRYRLTVDMEGEGTTTPEEGEHTYRSGTRVALEAEAAEGWEFISWRVDEEKYDDATIEVLMNTNKKVKAVFQEIKDLKENKASTEEKEEELVIILTIDSYIALVNYQEVEIDAAPYIQKAAGRTLVPVRFVSEQLGANVQWLEDTRQVIITYEDREILLTIGSHTVFVDGEETEIDCMAEISESRTFVPLRFVSETLGATVDWDGESRTVTIKVIKR